MLDINTIRRRFPALTRQLDGRPVVYFDNPAGTQVPDETIDGFSRYLSHSNANTGGFFGTSQETDALIAEARAALADFLHAPDPDCIAFGPNMTTITFKVAHALGRMLNPGDEIVTTRLEHDANIAPWLMLEAAGAVVRFIDIDPSDMTLNMTSAEEVIGPRTRLVAAGLASNAFGTVNDVRRLGELAHARNAWLFVDAVHYGPHGPIDVLEIGADLLVCSSYKFFGPHLGILYGRSEVLDILPVDHVRPAGDEAPDKWETGTSSHESLSGLLGTIRYLESLAPAGSDRPTRLRDALAAIRSYERTLSERLFAGLLAIPGLTLYGIADPTRFDWRVPTASFLIDGVDAESASAALGREGIYTWAGDHYAVEPMRRLGIPMTQRIGLTHYNTSEEIDRFLEALARVAERRPVAGTSAV
jgi:cysteine desulfurase family protein (TIGR01976 family)